jgi:hypothetical protein
MVVRDSNIRNRSKWCRTKWSAPLASKWTLSLILPGAHGITAYPPLAPLGHDRLPFPEPARGQIVMYPRVTPPRIAETAGSRIQGDTPHLSSPQCVSLTELP